MNSGAPAVGHIVSIYDAGDKFVIDATDDTGDL